MTYRAQNNGIFIGSRERVPMVFCTHRGLSLTFFFARRYQSVQEMLRAQIIAHPTKPMIMLLPAESFLRSEKTSTMSTRDDETQKSYVYPSLLFLDEKEIKGNS